MEMDRNFLNPAYDYESPTSHDRYTQSAFRSVFLNELVSTPYKNYYDVTSLIPKDKRMSVLDEIGILIEREKEIRMLSGNPKEALNDPLFDRQIKGNPFLWEYTHIALRAPKGVDNLGYYEEVVHGRKHLRVDYVVGDKVVAEGVSVPASRGGKVVSMNPVLRIPDVVSFGNEPGHTTHWYFDVRRKEVAVLISGLWYPLGPDGCLILTALYDRSVPLPVASFRLFEGSLCDVPLLAVEQPVGD